MLNIRQIVFGGQTGADRAALDWAIENDIPHGGWCPRVRLSEQVASGGVEAFQGSFRHPYLPIRTLLRSPAKLDGFCEQAAESLRQCRSHPFASGGGPMRRYGLAVHLRVWYREAKLHRARI